MYSCIYNYVIVIFNIVTVGQVLPSYDCYDKLLPKITSFEIRYRHCNLIPNVKCSRGGVYIYDQHK